MGLIFRIWAGFMRGPIFDEFWLAKSWSQKSKKSEKELRGDDRGETEPAEPRPRRVPPLRPGKPSPGWPAMLRQCARASLGIAFASFFDFLQIFLDFWIVQKSYKKQRIRGLPKTTQISIIPPNDAQCVNFHGLFMTCGRAFFIEFRDPAKPLKTQQVSCENLFSTFSCLLFWHRKSIKFWCFFWKRSWS